MIVNPIVVMLYNEQLKRWHPLYFKEAPLPGSYAKDNPIRYKSAGHHTVGFDTREAALANIHAELVPALEQESGGPVKLSLAEDIPWDGVVALAICAFFIETEDGLKMQDAGDLGHLVDALEIANRALPHRPPLTLDQLRERKAEAEAKEWPEIIGEENETGN